MKKKFELQERALYNVVCVYRERGNYLQRLEQFEKAIQAYNEALRWNDSDVRSLLGRSLARAKATHYVGALADAARAAELEPENLTALQIRAQTEYEKCAFERALVLAHRGQRLRQFPPDFAECARHAEETVRECVGRYARKVLAHSGQLKVELQSTYINDEPEEAVPVRRSRMSPQPTHQVQEMSRIEKQRADNIARLMASKYLERMAHDKYFLIALCKDERLASANKLGSQKLKELADQALADIEKRQAVLRERRPLYAARAAETAARARLARARKEQLTRAQRQHTNDAKRLLKTALALLEKRDTAKCLEHVEFAMDRLSKKPGNLLPNKETFLQELQDIVANAFLDQKRVKDETSESDREKRAFVLLGIALSREPSRDSVLRVRPPAPPRDVVQRLRNLERSLTLSARATERCYILHELARLYIDNKQGMKARFYAAKCQAEARAIKKPVWLLNATFLLAKAHVLQNNRPEARAALLEGFATARSNKMDDVAAFFDTCVNVSTEGEVAAAEASLENREKAMVSLMQDDDLKSAAQHLFKRMSVIPVNSQREAPLRYASRCLSEITLSDNSIQNVTATNLRHPSIQRWDGSSVAAALVAGRRFSVLPGARMEDSSAAPNIGRRVSIIPGKQQPTRISSKKNLPLGLQEFDI